jgi:Fe-S-cluster-containing dehydrogenase component
MINFDFIDRRDTIRTAAFVCWHCEDPTCAQVCPADAIKKGEDGIVQSSLKPRCIACSNCVLACPFGIPKMVPEYEQMMKCDMCYDRTSIGKRPMCATVCPSQALAYVPPERIARERRERPANVFQFGNQVITTKVFMMVPPQHDAVAVDVVDYMWEGGNEDLQATEQGTVVERGILDPYW